MITSASNNRLKALKLLMARAGQRKKQGLYTVEGPNLFMEAPSSLIRGVYISESYSKRLFELKGSPCRDKELEDIGHRLSQLDYEVVEDSLFSRITDTRTPQGIITLISMERFDPKDILGAVQSPSAKEAPGKMPFFILLESIQDPGNLGTIIRSGEAAGVTGIILNNECTDPYGPKAVRASAGSIFRMPVYSCDDTKELVCSLKDRGVRAYAAHLKGSKAHTAADFTGPVLFMTGNEGKGLSQELTSLADQLIRIPMEGRVESLNASIATTIIMYEVHRQRNS